MIKLDVHTHTVMSGHAYSTMQEMVTAAQQKHLDILGITEHAPGIPGTCHPIYFRNLHVVPRQYDGLRLLLGAELNILDTKGIEENTQGMINAIRNPWTQIISHPGDGTAELLFEPIVLAAKETKTLLEINNSSLNPVREKGTALKNNLEILRLCKRYEVPVILSSDAHISYAIADYSFIWPLLQETDFPDQLIMNYDTERFLEYISRKGGTQ